MSDDFIPMYIVTGSLFYPQLESVLVRVVQETDEVIWISFFSLKGDFSSYV